MTRKKLFVVPLMVLALATLAALACSAVGGTTGPTEVPSLFKDDFSDSSVWSTFTSNDASVEYIEGEYVMKILTPDWYVWGRPEESFENVHIEVTAKNTGGVTSTTFGIICNYQGDTSFYYVGIDTQGFYAIFKTNPSPPDQTLTNNGEWGESADIAKDAASYRVGADCGNGVITLYVDGTQIASASDSEYAQGDVGLFAWTGEEVNSEIRFDDLVVTALP